MSMLPFRARFGLDDHLADEDEIVASIRKRVLMRGMNAWVLSFAIVLASVGLNVNSIPVVIGAMLISPLMGPIMGLGLGAALYDVPLIRQALGSLALTVGISLGASALYFLISPLDQAQSELLARTTPTIWDVIIAFFGGLAGIVAGVSKEKGDVVAGVAIATALMPPLCTAGFGLAHGDFRFFIGAFYLFCINAVFIGVATFLVVRLLNFRTVTFVDSMKRRRVRATVILLVLIMMVPSTFIAYVTVRRAVFDHNAREFLSNEVESTDTHVLVKTIDYSANSIHAVTIGKQLTQSKIDSIQNLRVKYGLGSARVQIRQGLGEARKSELQDLRKTVNQEMIAMQLSLENERTKHIADSVEAVRLQTIQLSREVFALEPSITSFGLARVSFERREQDSTTTQDTLTTAYLHVTSNLSRSQLKNLQSWLETRTHSDTVAIVLK